MQAWRGDIKTSFFFFSHGKEADVSGALRAGNSHPTHSGSPMKDAEKKNKCGESKAETTGFNGKGSERKKKKKTYKT